MDLQGGLNKRDPHSENAFTLSQKRTPPKKIRKYKGLVFCKNKNKKILRENLPWIEHSNFKLHSFDFTIFFYKMILVF